MRTKDNLTTNLLNDQTEIKLPDPFHSVEEIIICDSDDEPVKETNRLDVCNNLSPKSIKFVRHSNLRGLLPSCGKDSLKNIPKSIERCCEEHCYFMRYRPKPSRYNLRKKSTNGADTLTFENENSNEQQTIDFKCLAFPEKDDSISANNPLSKSNDSLKRTKCKSRIRSSSESESLGADDINDKDYCPEENSSDGSTVSSGSAVSQKNIFKPSVRYENSSKLKRPDYRIPNNFVSVHDLITKIKNMQKLAKPEKKDQKAKALPPKLKKISRGKSEDAKSSEYLFPMPNLTKMVNGDKNFRVDSEIQNLGLDDLLLKASELNAENFTKALGRKLDSIIRPHFNSKDSSDIIFAIPKSKRTSTDEQNPEVSEKRSKTIKLDISRPFFESETSGEKEPAPKPPEESPKKPGIKVKTVENINEEFKDSLGLKKFDCGIGGEKSNGTVETRNSFSSEGPKEDLEKKEERPFVMTIIQSKTENPRPAILRNSTYFKKKKVNPDKSDPLEDKTDKEVLDTLPKPADSCGSSTFSKSFTSVLPEETDKDFAEKFTIKKRNIPFILNRNRKPRQEVPVSTPPPPQSLTKLVKANEEKNNSEKSLKVTSIEQKIAPKEGNKRFIKVVPYEPVKTSKSVENHKVPEPDTESSTTPPTEASVNPVLSLSAFSNILKDILPERWVLCMDKKFGLQIIKTHIDDLLNPALLMSVVIARSGQLTVNVRGRQLKKSHYLFSHLCDERNPENKLSLTYVLGVLNKLRCLRPCLGCDDPILKKYWSDEGFVETHNESQQIFRSHSCHLLVTLGKKRCYPCFRLNESLKKRYRRDKLAEEEAAGESDEGSKTKRVKRNLEDFLEETFSTMKQQISDEIEKNKKMGEQENALKEQEEVLSFMGLTRKDSLSNPVRKSKRKKNSFFKFEQPVKKKIDQQELEFLEKYWTDINTLFSTSLLFGAYSRTGRGRLREKCRMFQKLLSTWRDIVKSNPEMIGGEFCFADTLDGSQSKEERFEDMDDTALRNYIINSVKEVNRIKHKLRTRNSYFKILYNKFVKRRMKKPKPLESNENKESVSSTNSTTNTPIATDPSSDESSRDKEKTPDDEIRSAVASASDKE